MKKSLLAFSLMAFGSLQLNAGFCPLVATPMNNAAYGAAGCELLTGGNTWNLSTFGFSAPNSGFPSGFSTADINVRVSPWTSAAGGLGFQVTTTRVGGGNFSVSNSSNLFLETMFQIKGAGVTGYTGQSTGIIAMGGSINQPTSGPIVFEGQGSPNDGLGGYTTA